ncbi:Sorting nexin mvp1 [Gryganskiella cystojenkinii]|nr:Sorting nexin mvp1 [Gryganskiella cystojenkinii]
MSENDAPSFQETEDAVVATTTTTSTPSPQQGTGTPRSPSGATISPSLLQAAFLYGGVVEPGQGQEPKEQEQGQDQDQEQDQDQDQEQRQRLGQARSSKRLSRLPPRPAVVQEPVTSSIPPPVLHTTTPVIASPSQPQPQSHQQPAAEKSTTATTTKPVFSLFLTPDQRKQKQKEETQAIAQAAAAENLKGATKRGRKPKNKTGTGQHITTPSAAVPTSAATTAPLDLKSVIDPNISKTGETHRFFQEVKASKLLATESTNSSNGDLIDDSKQRKKWSSVQRDSHLPNQHEQFHGTETIDAINGVVARICGIDAYSNLSKTSTVALDSLQSLSLSRPRSNKFTRNKKVNGDQWYSLRTGTAPNLGITPSDSNPRSAAKDGWMHWCCSGTTETEAASSSERELSLETREVKMRNWAEKPYRLFKPTVQDRQVLSRHTDPAEYPSCKRLAPDQPLSNHLWATTLLSAPSLSAARSLLPSQSSSLSAPSLETGQPPATELSSEQKVGELWTEKYKPTQGSEVLGNRANTEYLTQWLRGLEVSGWTLNPEEQSASSAANAGGSVIKKLQDLGPKKRRPMKRARRKDFNDLDDFVVYDDDADFFEDPYGISGNASEEENDGYFAATKPLSSFSRLVHPEVVVAETDPIINGVSMGKTLPSNFDVRSNAILLSGPIGSCKTAAVYACAEESGYEVFEVSPGMKRTGKDVLGLVGEMAENHHVHVVAGGKGATTEEVHPMFTNGNTPQEAASTTIKPPPAPAKSTIQSFFQQQSKPPVPVVATLSPAEDTVMEDAVEIDVQDRGSTAFTEAQDDQPTSKSGSSPSSSTHESSRSSSPSRSAMDENLQEPAENDSLAFHEDTLSDLYSLLATTNPRQSLILLEEVDILFEEDKGFWTSIVTLLAKSKRPVVMTCNDTSRIPATTIRFQEHLEFSRPSLPELQHYLTAICNIEGFVCSPEYITALIRLHGQHDVRKCLMQLQYDAGLSRTQKLFPSPVPVATYDRQLSQGSSPTTRTPPSPSSPAPASPTRRKPQRLLRISARGIIPASAPTSVPLPASPTTSAAITALYKSATPVPPPVRSIPVEWELLEAQGRYAEYMSLSDACLRMKPSRAVQCYEVDQYGASRDDVIGQQQFSIWKRPSGSDHLFLDQEIASLFEDDSESLLESTLSLFGGTMDQAGSFEDSVKRMDPARELSENFIPKNDDMSRTLQKMQPALEQTLSLHSLRFQLSTTFMLYAPMLRSMLQAQELNTFVPSGKRAMRSGGHLKRHLQILSDQEASALLSTAIDGHRC